MKYFLSTLGKILCVLISVACIAFLIYMNINDRTLEQQAADEVAAVNEDAREAEKELAQAEAEYENVTLKPSEAQKQMVESLAERAERVRNRMVDSSVDNMLKITNDGRKLALDQRLMNDMLPDDPNSKASVCQRIRGQHS